MRVALQHDPPRTARGLIRVASVPANHVYVHHLGTDGVERLPDPAPRVSHAQPGQWWPPAMLNADWIHEHCDEFDVFHVHFGFDAVAPADLQDVVAALRDCARPLVYTVHDLRNPHHETPHAHDSHLDVLVPAAAALITLTPGAAAVIEQRWGRHAHVLPHPHVVDFARMSRARAHHDDFVVGVHAKSVRASMAPIPVLEALLPLAGELPDLRLEVNVHHDVFDADGLRHDPALRAFLLEHAGRGRLHLAVHDCYTDAELWDYLQALDVSVLPYRFGTHSGWLEACHDLGTAVVAPDCGFFDEQRSCFVYLHDETGLDASSLRAAVRRAHRAPRAPRDLPPRQATVAERRAERDALAAAHRRIYAAVLP